MLTLATLKRIGTKAARKNGHSLTRFSTVSRNSTEQYTFAVCACGSVVSAYRDENQSFVRGAAMEEPHPERSLHVVK